MMDKKKKEEYERKMLIESLEKMPARVIATAYLHALNYELYGVDVTDKWDTAVKNTDNLQRAYLDGRRDEAQRQAGYPVIQPVPREVLNRLLITHEQAVDYLQSTGWMQEHDRQMMLDGIRRYAEDPDLAAIKAAALQAGFEGKEVRFYIGGRLFAIRELPG